MKADIPRTIVFLGCAILAALTAIAGEQPPRAPRIRTGYFAPSLSRGQSPQEAPMANGSAKPPMNDLIPATPPAEDELDEKVRANPSKADKEVNDAKVKKAAVNASVIASGQSAFLNRCIQCHDAEKSTQKRKSVSSWRSTVLRMAEKDGAEIPSQEVDPIAHYLASLNPASSQAGTEASSESAGDEQDFSIFGTLSPTWRGGNSELQNAGFVPDLWAGIAWQSANSPISATATACFSCHTEAGEGSRIELVEAAARLDLSFLLTGCKGSRLRTSISAGRLIVPFGAFAQQSNPGVYRTVSKPLIYNMGFRVTDERYGDPVLPMPYSDEGAKIDFAYDLTEQVNATFDFYTVNGLQGGDEGIDYDLSRDYVDNNRRPAVGGRATIGSSWLRVGSSIMGGTFSPTGGSGPNNSNLNYSLFGFDVQSRYKDVLRFQFEYARRNSDRVVDLPGQLLNSDQTDGGYLETELLLLRQQKISVLARYDWQHKSSPLPPPGSDLLVGNFTVQRLTSGVNKVLPGGSLLMFNHEYWIMPQGLSHVHVWAVRWAASF